MVPFNRYHGQVSATRGPGRRIPEEKQIHSKIGEILNLRNPSTIIRLPNLRVQFHNKFVCPQDFIFFTLKPVRTHKPYNFNRNKILSSSIHIFVSHYASQLICRKQNSITILSDVPSGSNCHI